MALRLSTFSQFGELSKLARHVAGKPSEIPTWVKDRFTPGSPLDRGVPWTSWEVIYRLRELTGKGKRVFEWGGGGSTRFFLGLECEVVTAERDAQWRGELAKHLSVNEIGGRWQLIAAPQTTGDDDPTDYLGLLDANGMFDVVLVDDIHRVRCAQHAMKFIRPGGFIVVDDAQRTDYTKVPTLLSGWKHEVCQGVGPCRLGITRTDLYFRPE